MRISEIFIILLLQIILYEQPRFLLHIRLPFIVNHQTGALIKMYCFALAPFDLVLLESPVISESYGSHAASHGVWCG